MLKYRYNVDGTPFDTVKDFAQGPNTHANVYGCTRQFFLAQLASNQIGIIWQDKDDASIQLTKIAADRSSLETLALLNYRGEDLVAATYDGQGNSYYLTIEPGEGQTTDLLSATLYKVGLTGRLLQQRALDTSSTGLNIKRFRSGNNQNTADMKHLNGQLGLILARGMYNGHQGAIAVVFDADTLELVKNLGQTSGHSFGNMLLENPSGNFVGIDLGDNYPRGVHLHRFTATERQSRVVYTFKTKHGRESKNPMGGGPYGMYSEISTNDTTYYRWSNDNRTYTELGGIVEGDTDYTIVFIGEPGPEGKALLNDRTDGYLNDARNLGLVQVKSDFERVVDRTKRCVVTDEVVTTPGITETAGFYSFNGDWSEQQNTGVVWLTNYQDKEKTNASRLKAAQLNDGNILLIWETWDPYSYVNTFAMKVTATGQKLGSPIELGSHVRLNRQDDVLVVGDTVYAVAGNGAEKKLVLNVIRIKV
ncbi:MAG: hypothetical protein D3923_03230 [Candidatus Electrothrix sp. AR3]|nr:hypothetical protein [Candidatus Electrothrix sp. AR3]